MKLYFLRHGLASDRSDWKGDDAARPLTPEGQELMAREAETIARLGLEIEVIVTSPLVRAHQTAEIVARSLKLRTAPVQDKRLGPGFGVNALAQIVQAQSGANMLLVGHEPDLSTTISRVIGGGDIVLKKGGLAYVAVTDPAALKGELVWLIPPKVLAL